jgi:Ser/Thr protein kinase RdoA (MazF antagonist)
MTDLAAEARFAPAVTQALAAFPIAVGSVELLHVSENVTWRVSDVAGHRYVLRLHRPGYHTLEELVSERVWIRALDAAGVGVPRGMLTRSGEEYTAVRVPDTGERRHAGLAHWTDGEVMERLLDEQEGSLEDPELIDNWFSQLGALIAVIHNQASAWRIPAGFTRHALDADGLMGAQPFWGRFWEYPGCTAAERRLLADARARLHAFLAALPRAPETYSLIHADLHAGNLLVHDQALAVIDFDDAGFGWHQYDLAVALRSYQQEPSFGRIRAAVLRGYRSRRPLSEDAAEQITTFILIRRLASMGWVMQRPELGVDLARDDLERLCLDVQDFLAS